jgi:hypothetical protein
MVTPSHIPSSALPLSTWRHELWPAKAVGSLAITAGLDVTGSLLLVMKARLGICDVIAPQLELDVKIGKHG